MVPGISASAAFVCGRRELRFSHIIPELCYRPAYDEKGRGTLLDLESKSRRFLQKGFREYLLCDDCEQRLGRWENLFKKDWMDNPAFGESLAEGEARISIPRPVEFRLFHLSILWRLSIASGREFEGIELEERDEHTIRRILVDGDPGTAESFPVLCQLMIDSDGRPLFDLVQPAGASNLNGITVYWPSFGGAVWFYIGARERQRWLQPMYSKVVNAAGELVAHVVSADKSHVLKDFARQIHEWDK